MCYKIVYWGIADLLECIYRSNCQIFLHIYTKLNIQSWYRRGSIYHTRLLCYRNSFNNRCSICWVVGSIYMNLWNQEGMEAHIFSRSLTIEVRFRRHLHNLWEFSCIFDCTYIHSTIMKYNTFPLGVCRFDLPYILERIFWFFSRIFSRLYKARILPISEGNDYF